uniref:Uncharacterized protein n=1 Tax=Candidatus Kentrum sp. FW TaxID=2126338 RepID=A0A450TW33_9GAMM|nr:MAG: hypothetical protein BECKFW1821C_GA0114237_104621 [Candidatus Kentron sp. FW]
MHRRSEARPRQGLKSNLTLYLLFYNFGWPKPILTSDWQKFPIPIRQRRPLSVNLTTFPGCSGTRPKNIAVMYIVQSRIALDASGPRRIRRSAPREPHRQNPNPTICSARRTVGIPRDKNPPRCFFPRSALQISLVLRTLYSCRVMHRKFQGKTSLAYYPGASADSRISCFLCPLSWRQFLSSNPARPLS